MENICSGFIKESILALFLHKNYLLNLDSINIQIGFISEIKVSTIK